MHFGGADFMSDWFLYIIDRDGRYYVGVTTNLRNRMRQHGTPPLLYASAGMTRAEAVSLEKTIKKWTRSKKEEFIKADGHRTVGE